MADPPVTLSDNDFSDETFLFNVSQDNRQTKSKPKIDAIYSRPSDETFIVDLEKDETLTLNGRASAFRLAKQPRYDSDPLTALAEYASRLLAHVNAKQGTGWTIENTYTARTRPVVIQNVDIIKRRTEKYEFEYSITAKVGDGLMPQAAIDPKTVTPSQSASLAGQDLFEIEEMFMSKRQKLKTFTYSTPQPVEDNETLAQSGAERSVTIRGSVPGDESVRTAFDNTIQSKIGVNETATLDSAFPGANYSVVIRKFDSTREAGKTQIGQYNIETTEGTTGA